MKNRNFKYPLPSNQWIKKLIYWTDQNYANFAYLHGKDYGYPAGNFPHRLLGGNNLLEEEQVWSGNSAGAKVGVISYDFKNRIEELNSTNSPVLALPDLCFFEAEFDLVFDTNGISSNIPLESEFWQKIDQIDLNEKSQKSLQIKNQLSQYEYFTAFEEIKNQIRKGNTYELNFCQSFSAEFEHWNPILAYFELEKISPMSFSYLFKSGKKWIVSASPERYIKKVGARLIAQPIKGTVQRGESKQNDLENKKKLFESEKEQAENLMITDLMRNDLAKIAETGSVKVDELFGVYALPKVFQMISTVSAQSTDKASFKNIIEATFPMGSMTGAPKIRTMEIIDSLENFKRGWFAGAFGVVETDGDFDFSVIIRSIIADLEVKKLYFGVGSAVTIDANPDQEYQECLLKAGAIIEVLCGK
jgi:para-aminobenzoate synthetase component 1